MAVAVERDPEHDPKLKPTEWSYACRCIRCRWEQWWHEADNSVIGMPDEPHPDGEYRQYFDEGDFWRGLRHPND